MFSLIRHFADLRDKRVFEVGESVLFFFSNPRFSIFGVRVDKESYSRNGVKTSHSDGGKPAVIRKSD